MYKIYNKNKMISTAIVIYMSHFLSSWGDRMWHFAIPLFLFDLEPESLSLSAAYGLTISFSVLLFGPLIGDWIDKKKRLFCVKVTLIVQNVAVILSATLLLVNKLYGDKNNVFVIFVKIGAIALGAIANLASVGTNIIIQKDWIVVVAGGNKETLANLNSMTRRIDLSTKILAPVACGQIMVVANLSGGAIFIMCWNAISMFIEYYLLRIVYKRTPALSKNLPNLNEINVDEMKELHQLEEKSVDATNKRFSTTSDVTVKEKEISEVNKEEKDRITNGEVKVLNNLPAWNRVFNFAITLKNGWKLYMAHPISVPCIGFSFLFMTILGFGYITTAYAYSQCFSELTVGLLQAGAAITGIIATFMFPPMRKRVGLINTGIINAFFQLVTLIPCILSIFLDGSPFFLLHKSKETYLFNTTDVAVTSINSSAMSTVSYFVNQNLTEPENTAEASFDIFLKCPKGVELPSSFLSLSFLIAGVIFARLGLWGFDLTITQLIQENVIDKERGIFNGVQSSLNNFMDLIRFIFVLVLPQPNQFGILIIVSSVFVTIGYIMYFDYARKNSKNVLTNV